MVKKQVNQCSIGCCKECSDKCVYYVDDECSYVELLEMYAGRCIIGADNGF